MCCDSQETIWNLSYGKNEIRQSGRYGALRHSVVFGVVRALDEDQSAFGLDIPDAERPVRTGAGKNDTHGMSIVRARQGAEEVIDRSPLPPMCSSADRRKCVSIASIFALGGIT